MKTILLLIALLQLPLLAHADMILPVDGVVTSGVGWRIDPFGSNRLVFHRGIDIAVPVGTPVKAVRKGQVVFAGDHKGHGTTVILEHPNGDRTLYGHNSQVRVYPGDAVEAGSVLAFSGNTGRSTGPHVHFERLPSGRPAVNQPELVVTEETTIPQLAENSNQKHSLELKMDDTIGSIIRTIKGLPEHPQML